MSHHRHQPHLRHDVYDDTHHNQQFDPSHEVTVHRHHTDSSHRHPHSEDQHTHHYENNAVMADPLYDMNSMWRSAERDMDRAFGGFAGGLFGSMQNMMTSMDRMFDEVRANAGPGSGGSYYYESRKMTVGPDGHVHEETVTTVPDRHGNPQTSRTVRDGDRVEEYGPSRGRIRGGRSSRQDEDVVIEEVDERGEPIHGSRVARRTSRDERHERVARRTSHDERHPHGRRQTQAESTGNWLRDRYNQWRSRA